MVLSLSVFLLELTGGYGVVLAKFQQTGRFAVRTADIQNQLAVNVDPHVIVTGEEELDGTLVLESLPATT